jgi:hypothetical protein
MDNHLKPEEVLVIQMALSAMIEDMETAIQSRALKAFNDGAQKQLREILASAKTVHEKIGKVSGALIRLDPYRPGDEKELMKEPLY